MIVLPAMPMSAMASVHEEMNPDAKGEKTAEKIIIARNMGSVFEEKQETRDGEKQDQPDPESGLQQRFLFNCALIGHLCLFFAQFSGPCPAAVQAALVRLRGLPASHPCFSSPRPRCQAGLVRRCSEG